MNRCTAAIQGVIPSNWTSSSNLWLVAAVALLFTLVSCSSVVEPVTTAKEELPPTVSPTASPTARPTATSTATAVPPLLFDGHEAYSLLLDQMEMGPRWPGSPGHAEVGDYIIDGLAELGWYVEEHTRTGILLMGKCGLQEHRLKLLAFIDDAVIIPIGV